MTQQAPAFQFYPNDWLSSELIAVMSLEQQGAYIRLLCFDWMKDGLLDDDDWLANLSQLGEAWLKNGSSLIRKCFIHHPEKEGYITNPRLLKERKKQQMWKEKSILGGKKSAASRRRSKTKKQPSALVDTIDEPKGNSSSSISSSSSTSVVSISKDILRVYQLRLGKLFNRRASTNWSAKELKALKKIGDIQEEDFELIEKYYKSECTCLRRDIGTLLNNWTGEVDRARNYKHPTNIINETGDDISRLNF